MKIRFETKIDDVIAFNRFHFANSPAWRRQVWTQMLMVPGLLAVLLLLGYLLVRPNIELNWSYAVVALFFLAVSIGWALYARWFLTWSLARNTRKYLAEGANRLMFGWREMELVNNRLVLDTELIHSTLDLRAIEKIVSNGDYTFVYVGSTSAYMVPMQLYPEEEYRAFVAELREAWENRDAPRPAEEETAMPRQPDERIAERPH